MEGLFFQNDEMSFAQLIEKIHHVNNGWHLAQLALSSGSPLARSFFDRKQELQLILLQRFPEHIHLVHDLETESDEWLWSIRLNTKVQSYWNACHLPKRVLDIWYEEKQMPQQITVRD